MNKTRIEWCDWTWNPIVGCEPISAGCQNCYAASISKRFGLPWGQPVFRPERLEEPLKVEKPARIFVCSMGDFFHAKVLREWKEAVFRVIDRAPRHTFIFLTKRPENVMS
jgi:protein gp37